MILVPPFVRELYPFSSGTMFAFAPSSVALFDVHGPEMEWLDARDFGLRLEYYFDPPVRTLGRDGFGRRGPVTINRFDSVPTECEVRERVQLSLKSFPDLRHVVVSRVVHGFEGSGPVQVMANDQWIIENEHDFKEPR